MPDNSGKSLYLQYGCGLSVGESWVNYDNSPTLWLQRVPLVGELARRAAGAVRFPGGVRYGDICAGLLAPPGTCAGIYASHVLEHLSLEDFGTAIRNTFEMLRPGGVFRLIVPDLEARARRYAQMLETGSDTASAFFMESTHLGITQRPKGVIGRLRSQFGNSQHLWMWDERSITRKLLDAGFIEVRRCEFNDADDPIFREVENCNRFVDEIHNVKELAMECRRPAVMAA